MVGAIALFMLMLAVASRAGQPPTEVTNLWVFTYGPPNSSLNYDSSTTTPAVAPDGTIYQGTFDGTFFALRPDGWVKWKFRAGREIHSSPAIGLDGTIYFGARDWKCYALTPAGKLKWTFATEAWVDSSPAIGSDGTLYFGSWDHEFYAVNPDGSLKWKFTTGAVVDSSPAITADGTIYFGSHDKKFYALAPDGRVRWTFLTGAEITASPAVGTNGTVYFSSLDGNLYALNPDGTEQWHRHTGAAAGGSPVVDEAGRIYVAFNDRTDCFTPAGVPDWDAHSECLTPAVARGKLYVSGTWTSFNAIATTSDRSEQWYLNTRDVVSSGLVIAANGMVYCSDDKNLYAIRPSDDAPPAQSSWPMFRANSRHTGRVGDK